MKVKNQEGWLAIEAMAAVLVMLISIPIFYNLWAFTKTNEEQAVAAGQLKTVGEAFENYVVDNYTTLIATATPTVAVNINWAILKTDGYVQAGEFGLNLWGQKYWHYVLQPKPGTLEIITLTRGGDRVDSEFQNQVIPGTAAKMGSKGGYFPSGLLPAQASTTMQGAYRGWQKSLTGTNIPFPGAGHLAYYSSTDDVAAGQDFLYRKAVPGNPQLNTMETALNMGDNAIANVGGQTMTAGGALNMSTGSISNAGNITATGTVDAGKVKVPGGYNVQVGSTEFYGDSANTVIRQDGALYLRHKNNTPADIAEARNITASGAVTASGDVSANNLISHSIVYGVSNNWGAYLLDSGWGANAAPQSVVGSAYVNDIYIRSIGKWASQMQSGGTKGLFEIIDGGACHQANPYTGGCFCPAGTSASEVARYRSRHSSTYIQGYLYQCN